MMLLFTNHYFSIQGKNKQLLEPFNILLFIVQVISLSLLIYLFYTTRESTNPLLIFQITIGYTIFTLIKIILEKLIGVVFSIEEFINSYIFYKFSYTSLASIVVLLSHFFVFYFFRNSPIYLMILSGVIGVFIIITRLYFYIKHKKIILSNFFYFILYLCTLEISPYYLLYKALL